MQALLAELPPSLRERAAALIHKHVAAVRPVLDEDDLAHLAREQWEYVEQNVPENLRHAYFYTRLRSRLLDTVRRCAVRSGKATGHASYSLNDSDFDAEQLAAAPASPDPEIDLQLTLEDIGAWVPEFLQEIAESRTRGGRAVPPSNRREHLARRMRATQSIPRTEALHIADRILSALS